MLIARNGIPCPVSITALGCALSTALIVLFVLCLLVALVFPNFPATHAWVGLFSAAPINSARIWVDGVFFHQRGDSTTSKTRTATVSLGGLHNPRYYGWRRARPCGRVGRFREMLATCTLARWGFEARY